MKGPRSAYPFIAALLAALAGGVVVLWADSVERGKLEQSQRLRVTQQVAAVRARLESTINETFLAMRSLAADVSANPEISEAKFGDKARTILANNRHIRNIGLIRGSVIAYIYPVEGNETALGVDLRTIPEQWTTARRAIATRSTVLAGPVELVQGGSTLIGRMPVFVKPAEGRGPDQYFGMVSMPIMVEGIYREAGLDDLRRNLRITLRGRDGLGPGGDIFLGDAEVLREDPVTAEVLLPGGSWQIAAVPLSGWSAPAGALNGLRVLGALVCAVLGLCGYGIVRDRQRRREHEAALRLSERRFRDFAETSADWFWELDSAFRFTMDTGKKIGAGLEGERIIGLARWELPGADPDDPAWGPHRADLEAHRAFRNFEYSYLGSDGCRRHVSVSGVPLFGTDGAFLGYRGSARDTTELKRSEQAARESARALKTVLDNTKDGLSWFDGDLVLRAFNEPFLELLDFPAGRFQAGDKLADLFRFNAERGEYGEGDVEEQVRARIDLAKKFEPHAFERTRADGTVLRIEGAPVPEGGFVTVYRDVTDLRRHEQEIVQARCRAEAAEARLLSAVEALTDGFVLYDADDRLVLCNQAMRGFYPKFADSIVPGVSFGELVHRAAYSGSVQEAVGREEEWIAERLHEAGTDGRHEHTMQMQDGRWVASRNWRVASGEMVRIVADITHQKQREEELERARAEAEAANRAKSQFLANMSHEIRTPMNGVLGMSDLLLDSELTDEQREFATAIHESGEALLEIINDILDFSKIEAGRLELEISDFDLQRLIDGVVELMSPRAHSKGIELPTYIALDVPTRLRGDAGRLRQILLNLTGNAIKFTDSGAVAVEVDVMIERVGPDETVLRFQVIDTGIGISEDHQAALFDRFTQADASTTRQHGGTGLGLAICKELVGLMGGEIGVESEPGRGSLFWFTARFSRQDACTDEQLQRIVAALCGRRVLIVDDNPVNRRVFEKQLDAFGMLVSTADGATRALELLQEAGGRRCPFDVAIIDHMMPETNGVQLGAELRADPALADVKLVLSSSSGMVSNDAQARELGFDGALPKPIRRSLMVAVLARVLDIQQVQVEGPEKTAQTHAKIAGANRRILVVDDVKINQRLVSTILDAAGFRTDIAANGLEAIEAVQRLPYDLVLMDVQMPEMDGLEATRRIRRLRGAPASVPIIAMTANAMRGDREKCLQSGMNDYVPKPIDRFVLLERIGYWLCDGAVANQTEFLPEPAGEEPCDAGSAQELEDLLDTISELERDSGT